MWTLWYYLTSLDERVNLRGEVALLRADPHVQEVRVPRVGTQDREVRVTVVFREGQDTPQDPMLRVLRERHERHYTASGLEPVFSHTFTRSRGQPNRNGDVFPENFGLQQMEGETDDELRQRIINQYLIAAPDGRTRLTESMVAPLRQRLDYSSVARRTFMVDRLPDGALPIFTEDPDVRGAIAEGAQPSMSMGTSVPYQMPEGRNLGDYVMGVDPGSGPDSTGMVIHDISLVSDPIDPHTRIQQPVMVTEEPGEMWVNPRALRALGGTARYPVSDSMVKGRPLPSWCLPGAWVAARDGGLIHQVRFVEAPVVGLTRFDTGETVYWSRFDKPFLAVWRSVPDPRRTWFERLLEVQA